MLEIRGPLPLFLTEFRESIVVIQGRSQKTAYDYTLNCALFLRFLKYGKNNEQQTDISDFKVSAMEEITPSQITSFLFHEANKGCGESNRSNKLTAINNLYKFLQKNYGIENNPADEIEHPKLQTKLPRYLTEEECIEALNSIQNGKKLNRERDFCIFMIFLNCGLRLEELRSINVEDIKRNSLLILGKGNKEREVPMNDSVIAAIEDWLPLRSVLVDETNTKDNALFISRQGGNRLSARAIQTMVNRRLLEAGLDASKYSPHKLRHTAATLMYKSGGDIRSIQEILGHESLATTQIYVHVNNAQKRNVVENNPLNNLKMKSEED